MNSNAGLSLREVNVLPQEQFEQLFGNVVEHCPEAARHVAIARPFPSSDALKNAFDDYLEELDLHGKESVLRRHPDLAGKPPDTKESRYEQERAGLNAMSREDEQKLAKNKDTYKEKFGFPFVICARENRVQTIISAVEIRLRNSREKELAVGIEEVKKICRIRIDDIISTDR